MSPLCRPALVLLSVSLFAGVACTSPPPEEDCGPRGWDEDASGRDKGNGNNNEPVLRMDDEVDRFVHTLHEVLS